MDQKQLFYKFGQNLLSERIHKERTAAKQSLLRLLYPLSSHRAIPVIWQNLESNVK